jgi:uncharacterized membrane protein YedE/YeeE
MKGTVTCLIAGMIFGAGLIVSTMVNPLKVQAFLDVAGDWDPTLLFVLVSAVVTTFIGYRLAWSRPRPWFADTFHLPRSSVIDTRLIVGAAIFGVGWGLIGYCPGPAITALASLHVEPWLFVAAMLAGNFLARRSA